MLLVGAIDYRALVTFRKLNIITNDMLRLYLDVLFINNVDIVSSSKKLLLFMSITLTVSKKKKTVWIVLRCNDCSTQQVQLQLQ